MKDQIIPTAKKYLGFTEKPANSGFTDADFEKRMKDVGFQKGHAWCSYFAELVWKEAMPEHFAILDKLFSGSATATFKNFDLDKTFPTSQKPVPGALAIYRFGSGWQGHVGIVIEVNGDRITNIEGNSNDQGGREGVAVVRKSRPVKTIPSAKGLNLVGYVHPI